jgi:hypothetical protein
VKYLCGVFELITQRKGKKGIKKNEGKHQQEKVVPPSTLNSFRKSKSKRPLSDMDFFQKVVVVFLNFELPLLRNAQKRHKKSYVAFKKVLKCPLATGEGRYTKNERPRTCTESIQKAPTHLVFCLFCFRLFVFHFQAFLSKWRSKTSQTK